MLHYHYESHLCLFIANLLHLVYVPNYKPLMPPANHATKLKHHNNPYDITEYPSLYQNKIPYE